MLVDDQPLPVYLPVNIGDAQGEIQRHSILVWPGSFEDTVTIREVPFRFRFPVGHGSVNGARISCQKAFPILTVRCGTDVLAWRESIKNEQTFIRGIVGHDP